MALTEIRNFLSLSARLATAGQPTAEQLAEVAQAGYRMVINLALDSSAGALPDEAERVAALGMDYAHIPVLWEEPTFENLQSFFRIMEDCRDRRVFVHCAMNMRVSAFVYLYRVLRESLDPAAAAADLHRIWRPDARWQRFIDEALYCRGGC